MPIQSKPREHMMPDNNEEVQREGEDWHMTMHMAD